MHQSPECQGTSPKNAEALGNHKTMLMLHNTPCSSNKCHKHIRYGHTEQCAFYELNLNVGAYKDQQVYYLYIFPLFIFLCWHMEYCVGSQRLRRGYLTWFNRSSRIMYVRSQLHQPTSLITPTVLRPSVIFCKCQGLAPSYFPSHYLKRNIQYP